MQQYYYNRIATLEQELKKTRKSISSLYIIRILSFLGAAALLILFLQFTNETLYLIFSITVFLLFLVVVKIDLNISHKKQVLSNKLKINQNELLFFNHHYQEFETGEEFTNLNPHLAGDFDLFGKDSLFQYLNRCSTKTGKKRLAERLTTAQTDKIIILENQNAIKELSEKPDFMENFRANGMFVNEKGNEIDNLQSWLQEKNEKIRVLRILALGIPIINLSWIILVIFGVLSFNTISLPLIISLIIVFANFRKVNKAHSKLSRIAKTFNKYALLIKLIEDEKLESEFLKKQKIKLKVINIKASESLKSLFRLLGSFDSRLNLIPAIILNSLIIFDIQIYCRLVKWKIRNKNVVDSWFSALAEIDSLIGLSTYAHNNNNMVSYPEISENDFHFEAKELGHPLLHHNQRICNDIVFSKKPTVIIITGANMAGKSTFLRTMSVNLIMAMNGMPVCAKELKFTPVEILSSIKIQDSLANNESYFYSELLRIKNIIEQVKTNPKTIVILDEILRGTNTKDKQLGSIGLLEKLIRQNAVVIIATHDLALGELENKYPGIVINNCFEVELNNEQLVFDYKIKPGISQKLNATFLLRKMEIISG